MAMNTLRNVAIWGTSAVVFFWPPIAAGDEPWWQFRGPDGNGHSRAAQLPLTWSETQNIVWKTPIHDRGWSSPVQFENQIWMTSSTDDGHKLYAICVDWISGKVVHDLLVFEVENPQAIAPVNSYATPTPLIEAGRVYLHYGTYGTACVETSTGSILWTRRDLNCDHEDGAGPCSSPLLVDDLLIVHVDGRDVQYAIALDKRSGETVWKEDRSFDYSSVEVHQRKAFTTPLLVPYRDGQQLLSQGAQAIYSYEPLTGKELWKLRCPGFSIAPRPVYGDGMAYVVSDHDHPQLWAIRTDGSGDVTDSHVVWKATVGVPARASILLVEGLLYMVNHQGILSCLDAKTGELVWKDRLDGKYSASPIFWGGRIYLWNEESVCTVIKSGREFDVLAFNHLDEETLMASPAVVNDAIIIRTQNHLYRVEAASPPKSR